MQNMLPKTIKQLKITISHHVCYYEQKWFLIGFNSPFQTQGFIRHKLISNIFLDNQILHHFFTSKKNHYEVNSLLRDLPLYWQYHFRLIHYTFVQFKEPVKICSCAKNTESMSAIKLEQEIKT